MVELKVWQKEQEKGVLNFKYHGNSERKKSKTK